LDELGYVEKESGILALMGVDAKDVGNAHPMARAVDDTDGVTRGEDSLADDRR
jgi:hypothetical protein